MDAIEELKKTRLMVLARGVLKDVLLKAVEAIADVGVTVFESTFDHRRADCVAENVEKIAALVGAFGGRMAIGAGTVLTVEEVRAAHAAGATFIVSPDSDPEVIAETKRLGMASIPGAMTPTEIKRAYALGADIVKLFPADDLGYHYIQNLKGPLPRRRSPSSSRAAFSRWARASRSSAPTSSPPKTTKASSRLQRRMWMQSGA